MVVRFVCVVCVPLCVRVFRVSRVCPGSPRCLFTFVFGTDEVQFISVSFRRDRENACTSRTVLSSMRAGTSHARACMRAYHSVLLAHASVPFCPAGACKVHARPLLSLDRHSAYASRTFPAPFLARMCACTSHAPAYAHTILPCTRLIRHVHDEAPLQRDRPRPSVGGHGHEQVDAPPAGGSLDVSLVAHDLGEVAGHAAARRRAATCMPHVARRVARRLPRASHPSARARSESRRVRRHRPVLHRWVAAAKLRPAPRAARPRRVGARRRRPHRGGLHGHEDAARLGPARCHRSIAVRRDCVRCRRGPLPAGAHPVDLRRDGCRACVQAAVGARASQSHLGGPGCAGRRRRLLLRRARRHRDELRRQVRGACVV